MIKCQECDLPADACSALAEYGRAFKLMIKGDLERAKLVADSGKFFHSRYLASLSAGVPKQPERANR